MKVLITGCHGFLSRCVAETVLANNGTVFGTGRRNTPPPNWQGRYQQADAFQTDLTPWLEEFAPNFIFHGVGSASVGYSLKDPHLDFLANAVTFSHLLDCCRRSATKPLIFLPSSAAVYGQPETFPISEEFDCKPASPYGWHKLCNEQLAAGHSAAFGTRVVILRLFSVFGAAQHKLIVRELFLRAIAKEASLRLEGTGKEVRDYLWGDDVAKAILALAKQLDSMALQEPVILNVASGQGVQILEVAQELLKHLNLKIPISSELHERPGNPSKWIADISRLRAIIPAWSPTPWKSALRGVIQQWQEEIL